MLISYVKLDHTLYTVILGADLLVSGGLWWLFGSEGHGHTLHTGCHTSHRGSVPESHHRRGCHREAIRERVIKE